MLNWFNFNEIHDKAQKFFKSSPAADPKIVMDRFKGLPTYKQRYGQFTMVDMNDPAFFKDRWFIRCTFVGDFTGINFKECIFETCYFSGFAKDILKQDDPSVLLVDCFIDVTHFKGLPVPQDGRITSSGFIHG